jgi:hypothetical protein
MRFALLMDKIKTILKKSDARKLRLFTKLSGENNMKKLTYATKVSCFKNGSMEWQFRSMSRLQQHVKGIGLVSKALGTAHGNVLTPNGKVTGWYVQAGTQKFLVCIHRES